MARDVKAATLASWDSALRAFCNWLEGVGLLVKNPFQGRRRPKVRREPKRVLSPEEMTKLLQAAKKNARCKARNVALLALMLDTGLRAGEVASLKLTSIDWEMGIVRVEDGKTGMRFVTVGLKALRCLKRYITHERKGSSLYLFLTPRRTPMNARLISQLVLRISKRAGLGWELRAHRLRHSYACGYLSGGGDLFSLMRQLGHTKLDTTAAYLHWTIDSLQKANVQYSPMSRIQIPR
ncbi:tyrosine-type recombinase/integrase [Deinococcus pimensis]|uniref:tyrosine-type recombinase/integrase n=1 Tax=Deinococcus pimensis TaxID=309888 RepID=UPI0012F75FE1